MPIGIAGGEIELREIRVSAENLIHQADAFKKIGPLEGGHQAHAGDDVAHRHVHGRLQLVLLADDIVRGGLLFRQPLIQPRQDGANVGIHIAQPLEQLDGEGGRQGSVPQIS